MKLIKKQISGITYFSIDNLSISLDVSKRYNINLWSEGTQKQGTYTKTLYFDDTLEEWRTRDCECSNKDKSLDFSIVIENNVLTSLETLKIYGIDNGGVHIFNEVYFELNEIGGGGSPTPTELPIAYYETYDASKIISGYLTFFNSGAGRGLWYRDSNNAVKQLFTNGEYPEGYITRITTSDNGITFTREDLPNLTYRPNVYKHSVGILNNTNTNNEFIVCEVFLNAETPPTINELLENKQLTWDFGVSSSYLDTNGVVSYCRVKTDGANFIIFKNATPITWNATDCIIAFDDVTNLLEVTEE